MPPLYASQVVFLLLITEKSQITGKSGEIHGLSSEAQCSGAFSTIHSIALRYPSKPIPMKWAWQAMPA